MAIPISYSEIYGHRPTDEQFGALISSFQTGPTFLSLAMWDLMLSLAEGDGEKYQYLQYFFIRNLVRQDRQEQALRAAALGSESPRPVFGRWQLLALLKRLLLGATGEGDQDPRHDDGARRSLGDACLMLNDLLFTEEQMARLEKKEGGDERERIHDELMTQWFPQSELIHVPDVFQAVARNNEYINIFDRRAAEFGFSGGQTQTLIFDSPEHFFRGQLEGSATRLLGSGFRPDDGATVEYKGPTYSIYQTTDLIRGMGEPREQVKLFYFNSATHLLEQVKYASARDGSQTSVVVLLGDWLEVQGERVPGRLVRIENGEPVLELKVTSATFVPRARDGIFSHQ